MAFGTIGALMIFFAIEVYHQKADLLFFVDFHSFSLSILAKVGFLKRKSFLSLP